MNLLENLNPHQKEAVLATSKYTRIIAGAGSGKTRVLISRVAHLIESLGVYPGSIVAITFTNKAANEMKERSDLLHRGSFCRCPCFHDPLLVCAYFKRRRTFYEIAAQFHRHGSR